MFASLDNFPRSLHAFSVKNGGFLESFVLFVPAFMIFILILPDSFLNGDMPVYAEQIREGDFSQRTTHIGYYLLGYGFAYLPLPIDYTLNLMSALFAAGTIAVVYLIAFNLTGSRAVAMATALVLGVNDSLLIQATHAEVYMAQTFFALAALFAWITRHPLLAGSFFGVSFLISPSSVFILAAFPVLRFDLRSAVLAVLSATIIILVVLAPHVNNYLFGARGLSSAAGKSVDFTTATLKNGRDVFFGFYALTPFLIAGAVIAARESRRLALSVGVAWLATFAFGEKFADVPVQLPVYCLATVLVGIGIVRIRDAGWSSMLLCVAAALAVVAVVLFFPVPERIADHLPSTALLCGFAIACFLAPLSWKKPLLFVVVAWLMTGIFNYTRVINAARQADEFAHSSVEAFHKAPENTLFVGSWNEVMRFNWNARRKTYADNIATQDETDRIEKARMSGRAIWSVSGKGIESVRPR